MAGAPQQPLTFNDVFEEEDDAGEVKAAPTVHHIRANSSIMQVKKILGASTELNLEGLLECRLQLIQSRALSMQLLTKSLLKSPTVVKSVSSYLSLRMKRPTS